MTTKRPKEQEILELKRSVFEVSKFYMNLGCHLEDLERQSVKKCCGNFTRINLLIVPIFIAILLYKLDYFVLCLNYILGVRCFIPNNYFIWEATRPITNCNFCSNITKPTILSNATKNEFLPYAYSSKPIVIKKAFLHWPAMKLFSLKYFQDLYSRTEDSFKSVDEECQFLHFKSDFMSIRDVLTMSRERSENRPFEKSWGNCHPAILEEMRKHYPKPHFLPEDCEIPSKEYVFMGYDDGATLHLDFINRLMWQAQLQGSKVWNLHPPPECENICQPLSFSVEPGDAVMRNALQKCRDSAENERAQLLSLVRNLEVKIAEQSANAQEDRWALQQAAATLTARAAALEREAEYGRNAIEREKEQLKTMKESLLAEQERILMQLTEEKLQINSEKARLETSAKLTNDYEVEKLKRESETAIQVAKQLTEKVNQERNSLHRHRAELEHLRRSLEDKERELTEKESEVDFLAQDAERKLRENKKVVGDARRMESLYKERLQELQNQWVSISNREKKLAEEKILLSKERLALYTSMKSSKGCVLCKPEGVLPFESSSVVNILEDASTKAIDAHTMRIRLEAIDDGESEVSKEDSHSAQVNMALI